MSVGRCLPAVLLGLALTALAGCSRAAPVTPPPEPPLGAVEQLFASVSGDQADGQSGDQQMEMEDLIAECMVEAGFEYTPVDYSQVPSGVDDSLPAYGTREFAEQYGYGATTSPWLPGEPETDWVDPNAEYVDSLSAAEQDAYFLALYGDPSYPADPDGDWEYDWEQAGCQGAAQHEVFSDPSAFEDERYLALQADLERMWLAISDDARLQDLEGRWASCMADAGYPGLMMVTDAPNAIYDEVNAIWAQVWAGLPAEPTEADFDAAERAAREQLVEVTAREIAMAVTDFDCRARVNYDGVNREVSMDHQRRFYEMHQEVLESWANDYRTS